MFAFALWNNNTKQLFCARDQLGIKPFYYYKDANFFAFASESRALAHYCDYRLQKEAVYLYLLSMYVPTQTSIFEHIKQLPPAHTLTLDAAGKEAWHRYWQVKDFENAQVSIAEQKRSLITNYMQQSNNNYKVMFL